MSTVRHPAASMLVAAAVVVAFSQGSRAGAGRPVLGPAHLTGIVRAVGSDGSRAAVVGAQVRLTTAGGVRDEETDAEGRFTFDDLAAGRYLLDVFRAGFLPLEYGAFRSGEPGTPIALGDGQALEADMTLAPEAAIAGLLRTSRGEPAAGLTVVAMSRGTAKGHATTDGSGAYRISGLPPGDYLVGVVPVGPRDNVVPTYFPGTAALDRAESVSVGEGAREQGIDFVVPLGSGSIAGRVVRDDGSAVAEVNVVIGTEHDQVRRAQTDASGHFSMRLLPTGTYPLFAYWAPRPQGSTPKELADAVLALRPELWAEESVAVTDDRPSDVTLTLRPVRHVSGHVSAMAPSGTTDPLTIQLIRTDTVDPQLEAHVVGGEFDLRGVVPGSYRLDVTSSTSRRWWVASAESGGHNLLDGPIVFGPDDRDLSAVVVTVSDARADVSGRLVDPRGSAVTPYWVVAFPVNPREWRSDSPAIRRVRPSTDGRFALDSLPAGEYCLAVTGDMNHVDWQAPAYLTRLAVVAARIVLKDGATVTQDMVVGTR